MKKKSFAKKKLLKKYDSRGRVGPQWAINFYIGIDKGKIFLNLLKNIWSEWLKLR